MKKLINFKVRDSIKTLCQICNKPLYLNDICSIKVQTINAGHRYLNSNRKMIDNYKIKCCQKCFNKLNKTLENIILHG